MFVPGLTEAEAVRLIDIILFGHTPARIIPTAHPARRQRRARSHRPLVTRPDNIYNAGNDDFFRSIVLRKRPVRVAPSPVTPVYTRRRPAPSNKTQSPSFPRGLCYLVGVAPANRGDAMLQLGSYPTVNALLNSWLFNPSSVHLVPQRVGLFHAVTFPTDTSIPVTLCNGDWNVGADDGFPRLPRNTRYDMGPPPMRPWGPAPRYFDNEPRGPAPRYFDNESRGPRPSDNSARPPRFDPRPTTSRGLPDWGAHRGRGRGRFVDPSPFQVQYSDDRCGRDAPRPIQRERWEDANVTQFELMIKEMKKSLEDFPRDIAVDTWNDMSAWLKDYLKTSEKSREETIPFAEAHFGTLSILASRRATIRQQVLDVSGDAHKLSILLADKLKELDSLQRRKEEAQPEADTSQLDIEIEATKKDAVALDAAVNAKEKEAQAADGADEIVENADFVPIDESKPTPATEPWPEDNWEDYATRRNTFAARPTLTGKVDFERLVVDQKIPPSSKTLMPRAVEFYTAKEIDDITPKSIKSRWYNFYEDPVEPAKCWSKDEFKTYHQRPGFHFMIARIAQAGAQFNDSKLSVLRTKLSERWKANVTFQRMRPRMDWMMATIPELTDLSKEILDTDLIRLHEVNASYVIRHFNEPAKVRDLEITIANTIAEPGSLYAKLKKRCQEFEKAGTFVGWRVAGVRPSNAATKYRATFFLKEIDGNWPWFYDWSHPHGSVPATIPLLNFDPIWKARKPYACQLCYNSDHHLLECPLPHVKIGGVPLVSAVSRGLCMSRAAAERRGWSDDLLNPLKGGSSQQKGPELTNPEGTREPARNVAPEDGDGDANMADAPLDIDVEAELARAKAEFNDPVLQLKSMLSFHSDGVIMDALNGRDIEEALVHLGVASPPSKALHNNLASGSGARITAHPPGSAESAGEFLSAKLRNVLQGPTSMTNGSLAILYEARNNDIHETVEALRSDYKMKFSWDSTAITNDWRDWCDARVTPQAASVVSTSLDDMNMLIDQHTYDYGKEASFLSELINMSHIILHPGIDIPDLARKYRGQFPAMLRKMTVSYSTSFPSHWTEKWLMEGYSRWLRPVDNVPEAPHVASADQITAPDAEQITPRNAATNQATAPDIEQSTAGPQRTYYNPIM